MAKRFRKFIRNAVKTLESGIVAACFALAPLPPHLGAYAPGVRSVAMVAPDWRRWLFDEE